MAEQEIELIDYLRVIWKRKRLIIWATFVAAAASLAVSISMPNVYEVSRTLRIGQLLDTLEQGKGKEIESREAVIDRLKDHRMLGKAVKELRLELAPKEVSDLISIDGRVNPHIRYKIQSADRQMATRIADWLAENIIKTHKPIFETGVQVANEYEADLVVKINSLEAENRRMRERLETSDTTVAGVLYTSIGDRERTLADLRKHLQQARFAGLVYKNTAVIGADTLPRQSVKARVGLSVGVAGLFGLMVSILLAFFLEYVEKCRSKESAVRSEG